MARYFMVTVPRGHCGNGHESDIKFAFKCANMIEAMDRAKRMPSVKHTRGILQAREIQLEEYNEFVKISAYERYQQEAPWFNNKKRRR